MTSKKEKKTAAPRKEFLHAQQFANYCLRDKRPVSRATNDQLRNLAAEFNTLSKKPNGNTKNANKVLAEENQKLKLLVAQLEAANASFAIPATVEEVTAPATVEEVVEAVPSKPGKKPAKKATKKPAKKAIKKPAKKAIKK